MFCFIVYPIHVGRKERRQQEIEATKELMELTRGNPHDPPGNSLPRESKADTVMEEVDAYLAEEPEIVDPRVTKPSQAVEWRSLVKDRRFQERDEESNFEEIQRMEQERELREMRDKLDAIERRERFR